MVILLLLLVFIGPPLLGGWLLTRFFKLSPVSELHGRARTRRLVALASLAALITLLGYAGVLVLSEPLPSAHGAGYSTWPWTHGHPILVVLLASVLVTLALLRQPAQRLAGLIFGTSALLVSGCLGLWRYVEEQQEQLVSQTASVHNSSGWQPAVVQRCDTPKQRGMLFSGSDFVQQQGQQHLRHLVRPPVHRVPEEAFVGSEYLMQAGSRVPIPHAVPNRAPGYEETAVRVVQPLPVFSPSFDHKGKPTTRVYQLATPFTCY